ncbi:MAG: hypothetical protein SFV19_05415 [Rhodospirillaceae bacterium]|nr:hypothetical protein [Rhodospirillaceae bacterium]
MTRIALVFAMALISIGPGQAADVAETMSRLMAVFPGTYDTLAQVENEAAQGIAPSQRHERRHVIYARIETPQIGQHVLFRQERKGGPDGAVLTRGLAVFEADPAAGGVRMWLRNIVEAERFTDLHLKMDLWPAVAFDPAYGGKCPFHWRLEGDEIVGTLLGGGCKIISNAGKPMSFDARWVLTAASLSIFDNTYDGDGKLMSGRADKVPTLYSRVK